MKKVRILLATYNGEKYLCEQLDSLVSQTYQNIEIFIRDDGSGDKTIDILKKYEKKYSQMIHIVKDEENLGYPDCFWRLLEISGDMACRKDRTSRRNAGEREESGIIHA